MIANMPMHPWIQHPQEDRSNQLRFQASSLEPRSLRTYTPTQVIIARSAGVFHWTPENRRVYDFTSGVLVANLGHNPTSWMRRFCEHMQWPNSLEVQDSKAPPGYFSALPMTSYNAFTGLEIRASEKLIECMQSCPGGQRMQRVMWAASGSEAIQKALWMAMALDKTRPMILATRHGFHGKKGLANAVTGSEHDAERDPRVRFIHFPMQECHDLSQRDHVFLTEAIQQELEALWHQFGRQIGTLITEPYLGGGGSYHPPALYLQTLERFCREHDIVLILDEVQANFGRTGRMFAFETYGLEPDLVVLGKGLGNGVPVAAVVGRADLMNALHYGEASDTWSANALNCAAVLATLEEFETRDILGDMQSSSAIIEQELVRLKQYPFVGAIRGERGGMVWGVECQDFANKSANQWANALVEAMYLGDGERLSEGVHCLGPLAKKVIRISPPLTITSTEAQAAMAIVHQAAKRLSLGSVSPGEVPS